LSKHLSELTVTGMAA